MSARETDRKGRRAGPRSTGARGAQQEIDRAHMARCLELARAYAGRTSPNPIVGCVIVDAKGKLLAEGAHAGPGTDHGERAALRALNDKAKGATLYVNLEPCNHHGRTPPCAPLVRDSGVARVVIGALDPIPAHAGGAALLKAAGIEVTAGVLRDECERANLPFFTHARLGRPAFTLKAAITLDGKIATAAGESKWITGEGARADVMRLRHEHDAVMVGVRTVLADDPRLTARVKGGNDPIRVVLDSQLRTPLTSALLTRKMGSEHTSSRTIIAGIQGADRARAEALRAAGAEVWLVPGGPRVDVGLVAQKLGAEGIQSVLVEGGGETHASLLDAELADRIVLYIAPKIVGGAGKAWVGGPGVQELAHAYGFVPDEKISFIGGDLRLELSAPRRDSR